MIRLVVTDLDGTFWDEDLTVPEPHRQAVAALRDRFTAALNDWPGA